MTPLNPPVNLWNTAEHALSYLVKADTIPHRTAGEAVLLAQVPLTAQHVLDLGTGDGRLLALLKCDRPHLQSVALDFSPTMLEQVQTRFADDATVTIVAHNLDEPLPDLGVFDAIVSSFAIHHVTDNRKRSLYGEIFTRLQPGGIFANLEHVASPTPALHAAFLRELGISLADDDPSNQLLDVETQLVWLRQLGFSDVDCYWKWLELALLIGRKPM